MSQKNTAPIKKPSRTKSSRAAQTSRSCPTQHSLFAPTPAAPCLCIGIDEAGRGCLAGPVVAAAVLLPPCLDDIFAAGAFKGLTDSKKLSAAARERLAADIRRHAVAFGVGLVWQKDIDRINILQATFHAMAKAAVCLVKRHRSDMPLTLYIDGNKTIPSAVLSQYWPMLTAFGQQAPRQEALVGGDGLMPAISAASILAKTHRDKVMELFHRRWPKYNFAKHKGYGTKDHLAALAVHGACPLHRMTFGGVQPRQVELECK